MSDNAATRREPLWQGRPPGWGEQTRTSIDADRGTSRCEEDCTIKEWPHDGPCEVQQYMDAPGRTPPPVCGHPFCANNPHRQAHNGPDDWTCFTCRAGAEATETARES